MQWLYPSESDPVKEKEKIKKALRSLIILLAKTKKKTPLEVLREIQHGLDERKQARNN